MSVEPLVSVQNLAKKYCKALHRSLWYGLLDIAGEFQRTKSTLSLRRGEFWALRNVSFELHRGEALAVMGVNGAGKSTLIKVLNGLIKPDGGIATIRGRVGSLLELGSGFDPTLSGRENVQMQATLHGIGQTKLQSMFENIVAFADIGDFLDSPVQSYSTGMRLRLAYATLAHFAPDVLLIDEALSVGDISFRRKCIEHMQNYVAQGGALLLVSHNPFDIQSVCQSGLLLEQGQIVYRGSAVETLSRYFELQNHVSVTNLRASAKPTVEQPVIIRCAAIEPVGANAISSDSAVRVMVEYESLHPVPDLLWGFSIWTGDQLVCLAAAYCEEEGRLDAGFGRKSATVSRLSLAAGTYTLRAAFVDAQTLHPVALFGWSGDAKVIHVENEASHQRNAQQALNAYFNLQTVWHA